MSRIQLTYGNSALAWGRDQARSAKALASESERPVARVLNGSGQSNASPGGAASTAGASRTNAPSATPSQSATSAAGSLAQTQNGAPLSGAAASRSRFARLLADISTAASEMSEGELAASGVANEVIASTSPASSSSVSSVGMHAAAERARRANVATTAMATPHSVAALANEILATQREDDALERRTQLEDRARKIGLLSRREPTAGSPHLSLAYDQIGYVATPRAQVDRKA